MEVAWTKVEKNTLQSAIQLYEVTLMRNMQKDSWWKDEVKNTMDEKNMFAAKTEDEKFAEKIWNETEMRENWAEYFRDLYRNELNC